MIEHSRQLVLEQWQPVLHPRLSPSFADRLVERVLRGMRAEPLAVAGTEALDRRVLQKHLAGGQQEEGIERAGGTLRAGVEQAQAFQLVAEEVEPQALVEAGGEDVEDRPAYREFARVDYGVRAAVALLLQQLGQALVPDLHARFQLAHRLADAERGQHALEHRIRGGHQQLRRVLLALQAVKRGEPLCADRQRGAGTVVGQTIPRGQFDHAQFGREIACCIRHRAHRAVFGRDEDRAAFGGAREVGHHQRLRTACHLSEGQRLLGGEDAGKVGHWCLSRSGAKAFRAHKNCPLPGSGRGVDGCR